jgi:hypothetical protein
MLAVADRARTLAMLCDRYPGGIRSPRGVPLPLAGSGWTLDSVLTVLAEIDLLGEVGPESRKVG